MKHHPRTALLLLCLALSALLAACVDAPPPEEARTQGEALRPTSPQYPSGYGDLSASQYDSPAGFVRVWWVNEGTHAVLSTDADSNGVPDFVEDIAQTGDEILGWLQTNGWRIALDDRLLNDGTGFGGDSRYDIYLVDFAGRGDGHQAVEACTASDNSVEHCAGFFVMENDFAGYGYPSIEEAVKVLVSHEYFHAVQSAYRSGLPPWWSEGTATWFEEAFDPSQNDFERLASIYFDDTERSLFGISGGPADSFSYGASIFIFFIEQYIGQDGIRGIFEALDRGTDLLPAIEASLSAHFSDLGEAFVTFAQWNLATGTRSIDGAGYPDASRFPNVSLESFNDAAPFNWDKEVNAYAAVYGRLEVTQDITLELQALDNWDNAPSIAVLRKQDLDAGAISPTMLTLGSPTAFTADDGVVYLVLANGLDEKTAGRLALRHGTVATEPTPEPPPSDSGGDDGGCHVVHTRHSPTTPFGLALALLGFAALRRRARGHQPPSGTAH